MKEGDTAEEEKETGAKTRARSDASASRATPFSLLAELGAAREDRH
jgi:hypothetical protein